MPPSSSARRWARRRLFRKRLESPLKSSSYELTEMWCESPDRSAQPDRPGKPARQPSRPFLYREFAGYGGQQAVWTGKWKGVRRNLHKRVDPLELYDVEADPGEQNDLAAAHPGVVARILSVMKEEHVPNPTFPLKALDP